MSKQTKIGSQDIKTTEITPEELTKIRNDLRFIGEVSKKAKELGYRAVVSGGYSTDGSLGMLTRPHRDIDIQIYGQSNNATGVVSQLVASAMDGLVVKDKGRQEHYHSFFAEGNGLGSDIYYVQVANDPFSDEKYVVKKDGTKTESHRYDTVVMGLEGVSFEATNPKSNLKDILYKRDRGDKPKPKHEQDIKNLELLLGAS